MSLQGPVEIQFLKERGYVRKRCPICGEYFWTLDPDRETCGEAPCEPYSFLGKAISEKSIEQVREDFLSFMEKRGHTRINRYPVIARWRDDLFLTSASIVDFQPFITSGLVPPPANPLTISQPCIRLKDVDKVGPTMGRHLTIFEMMAHHAFNSKERWVYWKERTVELFHEYATEVLGIPEEEIIYKEGIWEGGGNAGPDLEPIVRGLEIATLVFMEYKMVNGKYVPMDTKVVDTGYGLERITWLLNGSPTGFHAVYGKLVDDFMSLFGVGRVDDKFLMEYTKVSSLLRELEKGKSVNSLRREISKRTGIPLELIEDKIVPLELTFAVLDHTKALAFMLADGLVPSNVNEGYLGRLLIRRTLRILKQLGVEISLSELVSKQVDYWSSKGFPELKESIDRITDMLDIEQKRFEELLRRGRQLVRDILRSKKRVSEEDLVVLYESHGLTPEFVAQVAKEEGYEVKVPDNFFELIAAKHESKPPKPPELPDYVDELMKYSPTKPLYYQNPYLLNASAQVVGVIRGNGVILDSTVFYPEGGGQPSDVGYISWDGGSAYVERVEKYKGVIVHWVKGEAPPVGTKVSCQVDRIRRLNRMRHHSATHVILEAAKRVLGSHVWQWGAQKGDEVSRLDITHYKPITPDELRRIEEIANEAVMRNIRVNTFWLTRTEAEKRYGFEIYQGGVVPDPTLRIVEIEGYNVQACGGTHVIRTGDIGYIKIWRAKRIQDGVIRLEFSAGMPAVRKMIGMHEELKKVSSSLGVPEERLSDSIAELKEELKKLKSKLNELKGFELRSLISSALEKAEVVSGIKLAKVLVSDDYQLDEVVKKADKLLEESTAVVIIRDSGNRYNVALLTSEDIKGRVKAGSLIREITKSLGGGGGGNDKLGRGAIPREKLEEFLTKLRDSLIKR